MSEALSSSFHFFISCLCNWNCEYVSKFYL